LLSSLEISGLRNYLYTGKFTYGESENRAKQNFMFPLARKTTVLEEVTVVRWCQLLGNSIINILLEQLIKKNSALCLFCNNGAKILMEYICSNAVKFYNSILWLNILATCYKYFGNSASISIKAALYTVKMNVRYSSNITIFGGL
jgi:hypothetical protein